MGLQAGQVSSDQAQDDITKRVYEATVIWYNRLDGYGFMALADYPRDVLVHNSEIRNGTCPRDYLLPGDKLRCKIRLYKGRTSCTDLEMVEPVAE